MKLGDKEYWREGDEVYCLYVLAKGIISEINKDINSTFNKLKCTFVGKASWNSYCIRGTTISSTKQSLFHLGAITFDEQDRPISINYDYVPEREPKVMVTKLPHEFVEGEEILCRKYKNSPWEKQVFAWFVKGEKEYLSDKRHNKYCIPYKGNEYLEGKITNCESGKVTDDYVFPEPKVIITKLPHEFVKDEEVLVPFHDEWRLRAFSHYSEKPLRSYVMVSQYGYNMCIPFKGNEHMQDKPVTCESGKIPDDYVFPKQEHIFKPFDKVLVRMNKEYLWRCAIFSHHNENNEFCATDGTWAYCIPFEGNEHLLGTADTPKE